MNALLIPHFQTIYGYLWHIYGYFVVKIALNGYHVAAKQHYMARLKPYMVILSGGIEHCAHDISAEKRHPDIKKPRKKRGIKEQKYS